MKESIYQVFPRVQLSNRQWPDRAITKAPRWCSIDLRDGNQALPKLMSIENKLMLFSFLVSLGFKEIEVGMPGRNRDDFLFVRRLIEENRIPEDVTIQVMTQLKEPMIDETLKALAGCNQAIVHLFQSTSSLRRKEIFEMGIDSLIEHINSKLSYAKQAVAKNFSREQIQFSFSPEGFNTTEPDTLINICLSVINTMEPTAEQPLILNLMTGVETDSPNFLADQIENLIQALSDKSHICFSIQTHNDRGSAVAGSELALLAGVSRVEGCLLGHGERAGACCLLTLALNLYTQGISPELELSNVNHIVSVYEHCTGMECSPRHPYAGDLVFAAFSAPHQFAIHEAYQQYCQEDKKQWHVPYLPMDPADIGRGNDDIIRLNALSGRTGISYVMSKSHGYQLPRDMQTEFSELIRTKAENLGTELTSEQVWEYFAEHYFKGPKTIELRSISFEKLDGGDRLICDAHILYHGELKILKGEGTGALDTIINALKNNFDLGFDVIDYHQHALGKGSTATAVSYLQIIDMEGTHFWGVGINVDTTLATLDALFCALNRKMENNNG